MLIIKSRHCFQNDDYYSMVRGNKFMTETTCKHIVMNGGINFVATQKVEAPQVLKKCYVFNHPIC